MKRADVNLTVGEEVMMRNGSIGVVKHYIRKTNSWLIQDEDGRRHWVLKYGVFYNRKESHSLDIVKINGIEVEP